MNNIDNDKTKEISTITDAKLDDIQTKKSSVIAGEEIVLNNQEDSKELKSRSNKTKDIAKDKTPLDKRFVFGIAGGIICLLAIFFIVFVKVKVFEEEEEKLKDESNLAQISVEDTYEGFSYSQNVKVLEEIGFFYDYGKNKEGNKINVSTVEIDGLIDTTLQKKINEKIEETVKSLYDPSNVQNTQVLYEHVYIIDEVYIFNNVLSTMVCREVCDTNGNSSKEYVGINLDLNTMKDINFEELFLNTTKIEDILTDDMKEVYDSGDFTYSFSPSQIFIPVGNELEEINMFENKEQIAIYKRFKKDNKIFSNTINSKPYVYTVKKFTDTDLYGLVEDNLFIDTSNLIKSEYPKEIKDSAYVVYQEAIKAIKSQTKSSSKTFLAQVIVDIDKIDEKEFEINVKYSIYELDKDFFNNSIIEFVVASENKDNLKVGVTEYFKNTVMNADQYLKAENENIIKKLVDDKGKEIVEEINIQIEQDKNVS